jgi:type IV pilus assembly protein PilA
VVAIAVATFAWISIQKARRHSQEETVLCMARQLSAAADQYFLENSVSTARFDQLVGSSNYLRAIAYVAGETYPDTYTQGVTLTIRGVAGTRTVTYAP